MGIFADYEGALKIKKAYFKIIRIWGSKAEGWNGTIGVFRTKLSLSPEFIIQITTAYTEGSNPFVSLYTELGNMAILQNVEHDVAQVDEQPEPVVEDKKPKKKRSTEK